MNGNSTEDGLHLDYLNLSEIGALLRTTDKERVQEFLREIGAWERRVRGLLRASVGSLVKSNKALSKSIKGWVRYRAIDGRESIRISFRFNREGIYIHKGAGRGQGGRGSQWTDKYGALKKTDPKSLGKMGTGNRQPVDWFNPIVQKEFESLADIVARYSADLQVDTFKMLIPD